jgi:hypothetical protein
MNLLLSFTTAQLETLEEAQIIGSTHSLKRTATVAFGHAEATSGQNNHGSIHKWGQDVVESITHPPPYAAADTQCMFCGRRHSLNDCKGAQNLILQYKKGKLNQDSPSGEYHRGGQGRFKPRGSHH